MATQKSALARAIQATGAIPTTYGSIVWFAFQNKGGASIIQAPAEEETKISGGSAPDKKLTRMTGISYPATYETVAFGDLALFALASMYGGSPTVTQDGALDAYKWEMTLGNSPKKVIVRDRMELGAKASVHYKSIINNITLTGKNNGVVDMSVSILSSETKRNLADVTDTYPVEESCYEVQDSSLAGKTEITFLPAGGTSPADDYKLGEKVAKGFTLSVDNAASQDTPLIENAPKSGVPKSDPIVCAFTIDADFGAINPDEPEYQLIVWAEGGIITDTVLATDGVASTGSMEGTLTFKVKSRAVIATGGAYYYGLEFSVPAKLKVPAIPGRSRGGSLATTLEFSLSEEPAMTAYGSLATIADGT